MSPAAAKRWDLILLWLFIVIVVAVAGYWYGVLLIVGVTALCLLSLWGTGQIGGK